MAYLIALTGGIATGKSTVAQLIKQASYSVIDTDQIARQVVQPGTIGLEKLVDRFSDKILNDQGELNRALLAAVVFNDTKALEDLNRILHPLILAKTKQEIAALKDSVIFVEVPLLYEAGWQEMFDEVWVVYTPYHLQLSRLMQREAIDEKIAQQRIASQIPTIEKVDQADLVILNQYDLLSVKEQVNQALHDLANKL